MALVLATLDIFPWEPGLGPAGLLTSNTLYYSSLTALMFPKLL